MSTFAKPEFRSDLYSKFRPEYSEGLFSAIYEFHGEDGHKQAFGTALDVATGTGQVAKELSHKFDKVYGTDTSATMIANAVSSDTITYSVLDAEAIASGAFEASSVDLVTVGQAFHWFDHARFFAAAKHVLKPGGTLAIIGYGFVAIRNSPAASQLVLDLGLKTFKDDWEPGRELVTNLYRDIQYPFDTVTWRITPKHVDTTHLDQTGSVDDDVSFMRMDISLEGLENYIKTWSSYFNYKKRMGLLLQKDPVDTLIVEIMAVMGLKDKKEIIQIEFPTALILCRNEK